MSIIEFFIFILELGIGLSLVFIYRLVKRVADIKTERSLAYESEKGKNLATKEDIEEITKQIETIKSEISFESQRKMDFVEERKKRLLDILYYVEKISYCQNRLMLYARNYSNPQNLYDLNEEINASLLDLTHESHVVIAEFQGLDGINNITTLVDDTAYLVAEMVTISHNVANCITNSKSLKEQAEKCNNEKDKVLLIGKAMDAMKLANNYTDMPLEYKEKVEKDLTAYIVWLNQLFGKGLNFKYRISD